MSSLRSHSSLPLVAQLQRTAKTLEDAQEDVHDRYRRRSEECDRLRDDIKQQSEELTTMQGRLRESQTALSDARGQLEPAQFELIKTTREKDLLATRVGELEAAQTARQSELVELRRQHAAKVPCGLRTRGHRLMNNRALLRPP